MKTTLNKQLITRNGNEWETSNEKGEPIKISFKNGLIRIYDFGTIYFSGYPDCEEITTEEMIEFVHDRAYNIRFE